MQTREPIKKPFTHTCGPSGDTVKGSSKKKSMKGRETIPYFTVLSNLVERAPLGTGADITNDAWCNFPLDQGAGYRYSDYANTKRVTGRHLKTCFFYSPHPTKSFSLKNRVAARPLTLFLAFAILGGFLFFGGHTMHDRSNVPSFPPSHTVSNPPPISTKQPPARPELNFRAFCNCSDHPIDILNNTSSIISFLEDVCPSMIENGGNLGLSESGMNGLYIIYATLKETIQAAIEASNEIDEARDKATGKKEVVA